MQRIAGMGVLVLVGVVLLVASSLSVVEAKSSGVLSYCDLTPKPAKPMETGAPNGWPNGRFGRNMTGGTGANSMVMPWVAAPIAASFYTLRAGDKVPANDLKSYTPGAWTELHIRVLDLKRRYIGIVMYATTGLVPQTSPDQVPRESQVGSWSFPADQPFQTPATCGGTAVTHIDADLKPLHTRFFFTAPKGTGTVRFRVLLKNGEQNKGSFFWPQKALTLTEGPVAFDPNPPTAAPTTPAPTKNGTTPAATPAPTVSKQTAVVLSSKPGLCCADVCYSQAPLTPYCDSAAVRQINNADALSAAATQGEAQCRLPLLSSCAYAAGAPRLEADGFCSFPAASTTSSATATPASCPKSFADATQRPDHLPDPCFTSVAKDARPLCSCTNQPGAQPQNPFAVKSTATSKLSKMSDEADEQLGQDIATAVNAAPTATRTGAMTTLLAGATALAVAGSKQARMGVIVVMALLLCVSSLVAPVQAHNYIKTLHRAREASVAVPCQVRVGTQPHVQVTANQDFEVEWSNGHGDSTTAPFYFAVVHEDDLQQLAAMNISAILNDYISLAPADASFLTPMYEKHHLRNPREETDDGRFPDTQYFKEPALPSTDPTFIVRDPIYTTKASPSQYKDNNAVIQTRYNSPFLVNDRRVSYASAKYPWLESVSSFQGGLLKNHSLYSNQADIARFKVPARKGPGDYVVYFRWSGYTDCVDINIVSGEPRKERYGKVVNASFPITAIKQDHCEFTNIPSLKTQIRKLGPEMDASQCIADCRKQGINNCAGVQVLRWKNPLRALDYTVNIPFARYMNDGLFETKLPCEWESVHDRVKAGCPPSVPASPLLDVSKLDLQDDDYVCFGLTPQRNQDNQVEEDTRISNEPEDPIFYSTCWLMAQPGGFSVPIKDPVYEMPTWSTGDQCVTCDFHSALHNLNASQVPDWTQGLTTVCQDCQLVNSAASVKAWSATEAGSDRAAAGKDAPASGSPGDSTTVNGDGDGSSAASKGFMDNKLYLGLVVGGGIVVVAAIVIAAILVSKAAAAKAASAAAMRHMTTAPVQMTDNPATRNW